MRISLLRDFIRANMYVWWLITRFSSRDDCRAADTVECWERGRENGYKLIFFLHSSPFRRHHLLIYYVYTVPKTFGQVYIYWELHAFEPSSMPRNRISPAVDRHQQRLYPFSAMPPTACYMRERKHRRRLVNAIGRPRQYRISFYETWVRPIPTYPTHTL